MYSFLLLTYSPQQLLSFASQVPGCLSLVLGMKGIWRVTSPIDIVDGELVGILGQRDSAPLKKTIRFAEDGRKK